MKKLYLIYLILTFPILVYAQVETRFAPGKVSIKRTTTSKNASIPHFQLKAKIDTVALLKEDAKEQKEGVPFRFGKAADVNLSLSDGAWSDVDGGRLWQFEISSPGAYSLNFQFNDFHLTDGAELIIYNKRQEYGDWANYFITEQS